MKTFLSYVRRPFDESFYANAGPKNQPSLGGGGECITSSGTVTVADDDPGEGFGGGDATAHDDSI